MAKPLKQRIFLVALCLCVLLACNFPGRSMFYAMDEIPFPTPGAAQTQTVAAAGQITPIFLPEGQSLTSENGTFTYYSQSGDTLESVARHFSVLPGQITSPQSVDSQGLLLPGQKLLIPDQFGVSFFSENLIPDSEVIFSPSAEDFDVEAYIKQAGGYLSTYHQYIDSRDLSGAEIVRRVAESASVNPRLLLAIIEFRSHWVLGYPEEINLTYPLGFYYKDRQGFYLELSMAAKWINTGYYGWRQGLFTELTFSSGSTVRIEPQLNAGTVALQYFLAQFLPMETWNDQINGSQSLLELHQSMFGDFWQRAALYEPLFSADFTQPLLELPFTPGEEWALTGGLHYDWNSATPTGALDFAPITGERPCVVSRAWVLAAAPGKVTYADFNIVIIDITNDDGNYTGWQLFYMHIADKDRIQEGTLVLLDDPIGHPSCEGGAATGTHFHFTRKYKGEWIAAGDPIPFLLGGWTALPGESQFHSTLVKGDQVVTARSDGSIDSRITR